MLTYEEYVEMYPPSKELELDCLYESIRTRQSYYISTQDLIEKSMRKEYQAYCELMKQKGLV